MYLEGKRRSRAEGYVRGRRRAGEPMAVKKSSVLVIFIQTWLRVPGDMLMKGAG